MRKKFLFLSLVFFVIGVLLVFMKSSNDNLHKNEYFYPTEPLINLQIDHEDTYIAISKNDISGTNRWIPFFFSFEFDTDVSAEAIEELLNNRITSASLINDEGILFFSTDDLIWSVFKVGKNLYNPTLVVVPSVSEIVTDEIIKVSKIVLYEGNNPREYNLVNYLIETHETIYEDDICSARATIGTEIQENLVARVHYGLYCESDTINSFELIFPPEFANIQEYKIIDIEHSEYDATDHKEWEEKVITYVIDVHFAVPMKKTVFRPFIGVSNSVVSGRVIPALPAYIN